MQDPSFLQPYVKAFGLEQISSGGTVSTAQGSSSTNTDGPSVIIGAGLNYQLNDTDQISVDYQAQFSEKYTMPFGINLSYRHKF